MITQTNLGGGGRLGNQLFCLSMLYATSKRLNIPWGIKDWEYNKYFINPMPVCDKDVTHVYHEPYFHYTEIDLSESLQTLEVNNKVYDLKGYFQSCKYWQGCEKEIKELFSPNRLFEKTLKYIWNVKLKLEPKSSIGMDTYCSIHVRRGDYVGNSFYADLLTDGYFHRAVLAMKELVKVHKFLIFSDDIEWCKENFKGDNFMYVEGNSDIEDLFLMSRCDHSIIANSSFSFWGAYLNRNQYKVIVAPGKWFSEGNGIDTKDLIPDEWVKL